MGREVIPRDTVNSLCCSLRETIDRWRNYSVHGCSDPFWKDGANMNLIRNHAIYYRNQIRESCRGNSLDLPWEAYLPIPPKIPGNWMAELSSERARRISSREEVVSFPVCYQSFVKRHCK